MFEEKFVIRALYDKDELHSDTSDEVFHASSVNCMEESWGQGLDEYAFEHNVVLNIERRLC